MPRVTIYLPDDLDERVRAARISVSSVCQRALEDELARSDDALRQRLAEYFRDQASWRYRVAEDYPDDPRNQRCAAALEDLAERSLALGSDHELLRVTRVMQQFFDVVSPSEGAASYSASRFHFHNNDLAPDEFLTWFASQWAEDEVTSMKEDAGEPGYAQELQAEFTAVGIAGD